MLTEDFKVILIEVNTNPSLALSSPLLARIIPGMLDNTLRLVLDPLFPPPDNFQSSKQYPMELAQENKMELLFDERIDGPELVSMLQGRDNIIVEVDEAEMSDAEENPANILADEEAKSKE